TDWRISLAQGTESLGCHFALSRNRPLYMQEALSHLRSTGEGPEDEHIARLSPLMHGHINMLGHYTFTLPEDIMKGELRPLNLNLNNELPP
ncbi:Tn3 family transposase, partial [Enterobacter hormaechei]|uniref:Tn3 family transposase n=1 Tax=Enterobacter hormaechei TaxID=158836 RepID=UPI002237BE3F